MRQIKGEVVDVKPLFSKSAPFEDEDRFHDQCGVFGAWGIQEASTITYLGLHALQHRGQESAGIVSSDGERLFVYKGLGLVQEVFSSRLLEQLIGDRAIGHVRYRTAGDSGLHNAQPIAVDFALGSIAVAHNGNFIGFESMRAELEAQGSIFQTSSDTELVIHLIARSKKASLSERVAEALSNLHGAFSMLFLTPSELIAVRDPHGIRPLCMGRLGDGVVFASEPTAFDLIGACHERDLGPGEMLIVNPEGLRSLYPFEERPKRTCVFEYVYFARPDSTIDGISVYEARKRMGQVLAEEQPAEVDVVIAVPDSGVSAALGYAARLGLPYEVGLIRSHYVGRTFIEPSQSIRDFGVRLKLSPVRKVLEGKRVAVIDDSIVRGTTSHKIVRMLRNAGAKEVHLRISSPPTRWPCFYGIDTPSPHELIASTHSIAEISAFIGCDSLGYLSLEGLHRAMGHLRGRERAFCDACFSGEYPIPLSTKGNEDGKKRLPLAWG
ncbi:MAG: amidophosphoribosyltransferase [Sandaracinaceae bacterium]|nr:amidophosphoribosyltransferase [Sandaracinaceae bacterium]